MPSTDKSEILLGAPLTPGNYQIRGWGGLFDHALTIDSMGQVMFKPFSPTEAHNFVWNLTNPYGMPDRFYICWYPGNWDGINRHWMHMENLVPGSRILTDFQPGVSQAFRVDQEGWDPANPGYPVARIRDFISSDRMVGNGRDSNPGNETCLVSGQSGSSTTAFDFLSLNKMD